MTTTLFSPIRIGTLDLPNRVVMAPMTRLRAGAGTAPTALNATYYAQRASAGLIVTEATNISAQAVGYSGAPGIYTAEQAAGWRLVTDAVHARGGRIVVQIWHTGRISHPSLQPGGAVPVAPSAIAAAGSARTSTGQQPFVTPRALRLDEMPDIVRQFEQAARYAVDAGFDGVQIHSANGYLLDQFLRDGANHRTDAYGGSPLNRARLLWEVVEAVAGVWGGDRVGVRLSPVSPFNSMHDSDPARTFRVVAEGLNRFDLAFVEIRAPIAGENGTAGAALLGVVRDAWRGPLVVNEGYTLESANALIARGDADLVSFAKLYIANPDLVERFAEQAPLAEHDAATMYGGTAVGYTDYPARNPVAAA